MNKLSEKLIKLYLAIRYAERGATAVEYGIMVALIAAVIIAAVTTIGTRLNGAFETVRDALPA